MVAVNAPIKPAKLLNGTAIIDATNIHDSKNMTVFELKFFLFITNARTINKTP